MLSTVSTTCSSWVYPPDKTSVHSIIYFHFYIFTPALDKRTQTSVRARKSGGLFWSCIIYTFVCMLRERESERQRERKTASARRLSYQLTFISNALIHTLIITFLKSSLLVLTVRMEQRFSSSLLFKDNIHVGRWLRAYLRKSNGLQKEGKIAFMK